MVGSPFLITRGVFFFGLGEFFVRIFFSHVGEHHLGEGLRGEDFFFFGGPVSDLSVPRIVGGD